MANELVINHPSGSTLYALLFDAIGQVWNGSSFVAPASASWTDYDIAMTEVATATGIYRASMPAAAAGVYGWVVRKQAGGSPAVTDIAVGSGTIEWSGTAEVSLTSRSTQTSVDDVPTVTEFEARTLPSGDYFNYVTDPVTPVFSPLTAQQTADAVNNLAPASIGAAGSVRAKLDAIKLITDEIDTSAVTVTSSNNAGVLTFTQGSTFAATVSGLTISATWAKLYFTLKESDYDTDDLALLQLVESNPGAGTDGLLYLNSLAIASPITIADGTLTVSQAGGTVTIAITDNAMAQLSKASGLVWDIKTKDAGGATVQNTTGTATILRAVTQTI